MRRQGRRCENRSASECGSLYLISNALTGCNSVVLGLILLVAAAFRFNALETWDADSHQHPDERFMTIVSSSVSLPKSIGDYFNTARSSLNPYANGQIQLRVRPVAADADACRGRSAASVRRLYPVHRTTTASTRWAARSRRWPTWAPSSSRGCSPDASSACAPPTSRALLLAITVLHIQLSHFFAVDTFVTFFAAGALFFGQRAWQRESLVDALLAGVFVGLATASKVSAALLLPVLGLVFVFPRRGRPTPLQFFDGVTAFGVALVAAFFTFRVAEPYAFLGPSVWGLRLNPQWFADKAYQVEVSSGKVDVPFMIQWAGTPAYTFALQNIVQWAMGPALGIACVVGLVVACWRLVRGHPQEREALLVVLWTVVNLLYFGGQFAKFLRYMLPAYFAWIILAAYVLVLGSDWLAIATAVAPVQLAARPRAGSRRADRRLGAGIQSRDLRQPHVALHGVRLDLPEHPGRARPSPPSTGTIGCRSACPVTIRASTATTSSPCTTPETPDKRGQARRRPRPEPSTSSWPADG